MQSRFATMVTGVAVALALGLASRPVSAQTTFYNATAAEIAGAPGTLIRQEPMAGAPFSANAYRVLYRSIGLKGEPIAVSGVVIVPANPPPAAGRPIVVWAHPTSGIIPRCAPSLANFFFEQVQGLRDMVRHGYVVAATDYPGLGTSAPHPYLVGVSEGRAVLDIARAARSLTSSDASRTVALWGHSQGGQAVLYAAELAHSYAPDLDIVGVAAAAPATDLGTLMRDDLATSGGKNLLAMTLWSWNRVFGAPIDKVVVPAAMPEVDKLANDCLESIVDIEPRAAVGKQLQKQFLSVSDLTALEPWRTLLAENTVGTLPPEIPVFLAQGAKDATVDPPVTAAYFKRLCAAGSKVTMRILPKAGHAVIAMQSATTAVSWIADRFAGAAPASDCGG